MVIRLNNPATYTAQSPIQINNLVVSLINGENDGDILKWDNSEEEWIIATIEELISPSNPLEFSNGNLKLQDGDSSNNMLIYDDNDGEWTINNLQGGQGIQIEEDGRTFSLINGENDGEILKWNESGEDWELSSDLVDLQNNTSTIESGTSAPSSTPNKIGDIYIDTSNKKLYFAVGTSSSGDWEIAN